MTALTALGAIVEARPSRVEVAILHLPAGCVARVHHPDGVREYAPQLPDVPWYVVVPGDRAAIGWGWSEGWYGSLTSVRNGKHRLDRAAWHEAVRALKTNPVAYVQYEVRDYHGKPRWTAVGVRTGERIEVPA